MFSADFNCIVNTKDATRNQAQKMSPSMKRFINVFNLKDSFRSLHPEIQSYSRYYHSNDHGYGATRIDRTYRFGRIQVLAAKYVGVAFSDHQSLILDVKLPNQFLRFRSPKSSNSFKANQLVVSDSLFKQRLKENFSAWETVKEKMGFLIWWEEIVKPGIKKLLIV